MEVYATLRKTIASLKLFGWRLSLALELSKAVGVVKFQNLVLKFFKVEYLMRIQLIINRRCYLVVILLNYRRRISRLYYLIGTHRNSMKLKLGSC